MNDMIAAQVCRMKSGDEAAFDWLYDIYVNSLYRMAYLITGSRSDSEDIVQETFVKCYLNRHSLRQEEAFEGWLYQILIRTAWKFQRKKGTELSLEELTEEAEETGGGQWLWEDEKSSQPLKEILKAEEKNQLWNAVLQLEIRQRTVIILHYYQDMSIKDIARMTGSLQGTVKSRLFQARNNLKKILEKSETEKESRRRKERFV